MKMERNIQQELIEKEVVDNEEEIFTARYPAKKAREVLYEFDYDIALQVFKDFCEVNGYLANFNNF